MPKVRVRDIDVYYEIHGSGPRLFFIGGSGSDLRDQPHVFDGPLAKHFEILAYDQRGLGQTDAPPGPYTMAGYGEDAAALLKALDFGPCPVMGVSFGGMVAQELVCRHPKRATRLVLACTSPGGPTTSSYPLHELTDLSERNRAIRISEILDTRYGAAWREANTDHAENLIKLVLTRTTPRSDAAERGQRLQLEARSHHDARERLRKITIPTYICAGKHDGIASPENQHALASLLPNGKLDFFDGGHLFLMQDPMAFESISEFLLTD